MVEEELSNKLEETVRLDFRALKASDVQSAARAFQSMVGAGMELANLYVISRLLLG